jgi:hypothetical protein
MDGFETGPPLVLPSDWRELMMAAFLNAGLFRRSRVPRMRTVGVTATVI